MKATAFLRRWFRSGKNGKTILLFPLLAGGLALLLAGCAQGLGGGYAESGAYPAPAMEASAPAESSKKIARQADASYAPVSRPGLGTDWGREVSSRMYYSDFQRASAKPRGGIATIHYNDREGVEAMTRYTGGSPHAYGGLQKAAGGTVEWGVKKGWGYLKSHYIDGRRLVTGTKGATYSIVVKNLCHCRVEAVVSVDGLDVMDGRPASTKKRGYLIAPGGTLEVKGFRTAENAVAAFRFSSVPRSYASQRHGDSRNVGVIGLAIFTEKGHDPWRWSRDVRRRPGASPFAEAAR